MSSEFLVAVVDDNELSDLLAGHRTRYGRRFSPGAAEVAFVPAGCTGVVFRQWSEPIEPVQPLVLIAPEEAFRRLCGRFAQLRSDLSPLTAWCHLVTPERFQSVNSLTHDAELRGSQAAWAGLVVAEAVLLSDRPLANLRISACLATQGFAIARATALWGSVSMSDLIDRFDAASRMFRGLRGSQRTPTRAAQVRAALQPIWACVAAATLGAPVAGCIDLQPVVDGLRALEHARSVKYAEEAESLANPLLRIVPEASELAVVSKLAPEGRLRFFDFLMQRLRSSEERDGPRRCALALLAGYTATIAAGGAPSLSLVESSTSRWPEITAWAYVVGGIGERVTWTSSFDGLGRLVSREMMRPLRFDEPPTCDCALDEALLLADPELKDPLVHLRIKQARVATVALMPGVNVAFGIGELVAQEGVRPESTQREAEAATAGRGGHDILAALADAVWPYLRQRVEDWATSARGREWEFRANRDKRRPGPQPRLPLDPKP